MSNSARILVNRLCPPYCRWRSVWLFESEWSVVQSSDKRFWPFHITNSFSILNRRMSSGAGGNCFTARYRRLCGRALEYRLKTDRLRGRRWPIALCLPSAPWRHCLPQNETNGINDVEWSIADVTHGPRINLTHGPWSVAQQRTDRVQLEVNPWSASEWTQRNYSEFRSVYLLIVADN